MLRQRNLVALPQAVAEKRLVKELTALAAQPQQQQA
jgi:hypothetical protein